MKVTPLFDTQDILISGLVASVNSCEVCPDKEIIAGDSVGEHATSAPECDTWKPL